MKFTFEWQVVKGNPHEGVQYHHIASVYSENHSKYWGIITLVFAEPRPRTESEWFRIRNVVSYGFRYYPRIDESEFQYDGSDGKWGLNPATRTPLWRLSRSVPDGTGAFWHRARKLSEAESSRGIRAINS